MKLWIIFRKKFILPVRWFIEEYQSGLLIRQLSVAKLRHMRSGLLKERNAHKKREDYEMVMFVTGKIDVIDYILKLDKEYGDSNK